MNAEPTRRVGRRGKDAPVAGRARASRVDAAMEFDEYNEDDVDDWDDDVEEPRDDLNRRVPPPARRIGLRASPEDRDAPPNIALRRHPAGVRDFRTLFQ